MRARSLVVAAAIALPLGARAQTTSDVMPPVPQPAPGQAVPMYPGQPSPPPTVVPAAGGGAQRSWTRAPGEPAAPDDRSAPPGRKGYDIYEPTSTFGSSERGPRVEVDRVPDTHVVKKGDTLWDIAGSYFRNPWSWTKLWALNPSITNPHWIYPGDIVRLMQGGEPAPAPAPAAAIAPERPRKPIRADGVFLRQTGFIEPDELKAAGKIVGSREEKIMLGPLDEIYVEMNKQKPLNIGERYTIYRPMQDVKHPVKGKKVGTLVQILGEAEVKSITDGNIARCVIVDATDPIERGFKVGPLRRQFKVVEPVRNANDLEGVVVVGLQPRNMVSSDNVLFIDKGKDDGVVVGNRFFVTRRGDGYQPLLAKGPVDDKRFPREIIAEILIIDTRQSLATGLVTRSLKEARVGDRVETKKGY